MGRIGDSLRELFTGGSNRPDLTDPATRLPEIETWDSNEAIKQLMDVQQTIQNDLTKEGYTDTSWVVSLLGDIIETLGASKALSIAEKQTDSLEALRALKEKYYQILHERYPQEYREMTDRLLNYFLRELNDMFVSRNVDLNDLERSYKEKARQMLRGEGKLDVRQVPSFYTDKMDEIKSKIDDTNDQSLNIAYRLLLRTLQGQLMEHGHFHDLAIIERNRDRIIEYIDTAIHKLETNLAGMSTGDSKATKKQNEIIRTLVSEIKKIK